MSDVLDSLDPAVLAKLHALRTQLVEALGDDLQALITYGSVVRGGYVDGYSDIDLLVILRRDDRSVLERIGGHLLFARTSARIEAMLLRGDELARAADVFPLLYDDVRNCHAVLYGSDPFAALEIADTHRRLRIEQELREARIRLRLVISEAPQLPRQLRGAVARKLKQIRSPLHALLRLRDRHVDHTLVAVLREACGLYKIDVSPLLDLGSAPQQAYDTLVQLLEASIADVDALEV